MNILADEYQARHEKDNQAMRSLRMA